MIYKTRKVQVLVKKNGEKAMMVSCAYLTYELLYYVSTKAVDALKHDSTIEKKKVDYKIV